MDFKGRFIMKNRIKKMFIGVEATTDYWITFQNLSHLRKQNYFGISLKSAITSLKQGIGDEKVIDHITDNEITQFINNLKKSKVKVNIALGGNAALEVLAGKTQGLPVTFFGTIPKLNVSQSELEILQDNFIGNSLETTPVSLIIQVAEGTTERYILNKGNGRRASDVYPSFLKAKDMIKGKDILIGLVGMHVLFGNKQFNLIKKYQIAIEELHKNVGMIYSDTGGFSSYKPSAVKDLFEYIYSNVDALSLNENELITLYHAMKGPEVNAHPVEMLEYLISQSEKLNTVWLHTSDFQISLTKVLSTQKVINAMKRASAAGCFRIEYGKPPTRDNILQIIKQRQLNPKGIEKIQQIKNLYNKSIKGNKVVGWPSYLPKKFTTSVGAGDTACVTYFGNFITN